MSNRLRVSPFNASAGAVFMYAHALTQYTVVFMTLDSKRLGVGTSIPRRRMLVLDGPGSDRRFFYKGSDFDLLSVRIA